MLKLTVTMRRIIWLFLVVLFLNPGPVRAQREVWISAPVVGEAVQGAVNVTGRTDVPAFASAELAFAYADNPTGTWFLIAALDKPVDESLLAVWDTTLITDGNYSLRLIIHLQDGSALESLVTGLRVRNYTPVEASPEQESTALPDSVTPAAVAPLPTVSSSKVQTPTMISLPKNPAVVSPQQVQGSLTKGALAAVILFAGLAIYIGFKSLANRL